jgi:transcriptional regulator GlxA family with amidase domain
MVPASAITVFPGTALRVAHTPSRGHVEPAALRRAVASVDANAQHPITVQDVAAAGTTPRTPQLAVARHRDITPTGYLRRVRLEHAHRDLQAADPVDGTTVGSIAASWGFISTARFAAQYRQVGSPVPPNLRCLCPVTHPPHLKHGCMPVEGGTLQFYDGTFEGPEVTFP